MNVIERHSLPIETEGLSGGRAQVTAEATGDKVIEDAEAGDTGNEAGEEDRRTGYYIAGHDWPAIRNSIALSEIYDALNRINDAAVKGALRDVAGQSTPA